MKNKADNYLNIELILSINKKNMNNQQEKQNNYISNLQQQLQNYSQYVTRLKNSFKRDYNEIKIEITQKDFELNNLKQQVKYQKELLVKQEKEIADLTQTLKLLCGEDLVVQHK